MSTKPNPIQAVEQDILEDAVTVVEEINKEVPTLAIISKEEINELAGQIWLDGGALKPDPNTLNNWLLAESTLISRAQAEYNG